MIKLDHLYQVWLAFTGVLVVIAAAIVASNCYSFAVIY